jgi:hypothetical protein
MEGNEPSFEIYEVADELRQMPDQGDEAPLHRRLYQDRGVSVGGQECQRYSERIDDPVGQVSQKKYRP